MAEQRATELDLYDSVADEKTRTCLQQLFDNTKNLQAQVDRLVDLITNASNLNALQTQVSQDFSGESIASSTESATDVSAFSAQFSAINHNHDSSYNNYVLNQATTTVLGGIKLGANLTYNSNTDQVDATDTNTVYSLPAASGSTRGGIRVGSYLSVSGDILSVSSVPSHSHSYAATNHSHSGYVSTSDTYYLNAIQSYGNGSSWNSNLPVRLSSQAGNQIWTFVGNSAGTHMMLFKNGNFDKWVGTEQGPNTLTSTLKATYSVATQKSTAVPFVSTDRPVGLYIRNWQNDYEVGRLAVGDSGTGIGIWFQRYTMNSTSSTYPSYAYNGQTLLASV